LAKIRSEIAAAEAAQWRQAAAASARRIHPARDPHADHGPPKIRESAKTG
jgi:hypothetical protein